MHVASVVRGKCRKRTNRKSLKVRKLMKFRIALFLVTIITITLLFSCKKNNKEIQNGTHNSTIIKRDAGDKSPLKITVTITGKEPKAFNGVFNKYPFRITIQNQTDSVFGFWLYNCSYYDFFKFNTKGIWIDGGVGCDNNSLDLISLKSGQEYNIGGEFIVDQLEAIKKQKNLRLGLYVVGKEYKLNRIELGKVEIKDTLIWCKEPIKYDW